MDKIIEMHKNIFKEIESKTDQGLAELKELILLLQERMDSELVNAKAHKRFAGFELKALKQNKIFEEMLNVADSKSVQSFDLIKNIKNDIYLPLCDLLERQTKAFEMMSVDGRRAMKNTCTYEDELYRIKSEYFKSKSEMAKAIEVYEEFKQKANFDEDSMNFYKSKLFSQMNVKMRISQEKGSIYQMWVEKCNENLRVYCKQMKSLVKIFSDMSKDRNQIVLDSLNKLVLFETSVDMNLKYDTKMFTKLIEQMQNEQNKPSVGENPTKNEIDASEFDEKPDQNHSDAQIKSDNPDWKTADNSSNTPEKSSEEVKSSENTSPIRVKWEDILDSDYLEFIEKFDQIGEYRYHEAPDTPEGEGDSQEPLQISDQIKFKYEEEIYEIVQNVWENKITLIEQSDEQSESQAIREKFETLMEEKIGRSVFLQCLNNYKVKRDTVIPSKEIFNSLSIMTLDWVDKLNIHGDIENALGIIDVCNSFYIENKEKGMPSRMYLTSCLQGHKMLKDINFWEKAIFESIRRELRSEFFVYDYDNNTQNTYRKIIFSTLSLAILDMLSFKIEKTEVRELILKFWETHDLTEDQIINLISKIANKGDDLVIKLPESITKLIEKSNELNSH